LKNGTIMTTKQSDAKDRTQQEKALEKFIDLIARLIAQGHLKRCEEQFTGQRYTQAVAPDGEAKD